MWNILQVSWIFVGCGKLKHKVYKTFVLLGQPKNPQNKLFDDFEMDQSTREHIMNFAVHYQKI